MSAISTCPKCQRLVAIPTGADSAAMVRCPLCSAEYPLSEALALVPPELILVAPLTAVEPATIAPELAAEVATEMDVAVAGGGDGGLAEHAVAEAPFAEGHPFGDDYDIVMEREEGVEEIEQHPLFAAAEEAEGAVEGAPAEKAEAAAKPVPKRRRRQPKSMLQAAIEIVTGGVAGTLFAYYGLAWYQGPQFDLPKFGLPFVEQLTADPSQPEGGVRKRRVEEPLKPAVPQPDESKPVPEEQPKPQTPPTAEEKKPAPDAAAEKSAPPAEPATPDANPKPEAADKVGPRNAPKFTSDDLGKALKAANDSLGDGVRMPPDVFAEFCRLGEAATFVEANPADTRLADHQQGVRTVLEKVVRQADLFSEIGRLAGGRLDSDADLKGGILLAGVVKIVKSQGPLSGAAIDLADFSKTIMVLSDRPLEMKAGDRVLVLGSVVSNPTQNLAGYSGTKPLVVWYGISATAP